MRRRLAAKVASESGTVANDPLRSVPFVLDTIGTDGVCSCAKTDDCEEAAYGAGGDGSTALGQGLVRRSAIGSLEFVRRRVEVGSVRKSLLPKAPACSTDTASSAIR